MPSHDGVIAPIVVWRFQDAPKHLRELSPHGGDEDWLAVVPAGFPGGVPDWIDTPRFGCCDVAELPQADGTTVCIGAHA